MRVPFPSISSNLAVQAHMYVCIENGSTKEFVKCQTFKPVHKIKHKYPLRFVEEEANIQRNPFSKKTTIDCDKAFVLDGVVVGLDLLTTSRRDVCEDLFNIIKSETNHSQFRKEQVEPNEVLNLNTRMQASG